MEQTITNHQRQDRHLTHVGMGESVLQSFNVTINLGYHQQPRLHKEYLFHVSDILCAPSQGLGPA